MEAVIRQAQFLRKACSKSNAEWSELSHAITELADAVELLEVENHRVAIIDHLLPLAPEMGDLLRNIRSKLVSDVCEHLGRIVKITRLAFTPLANALVEALAGTAKASSLAIRTPGFQLFSDVSEYSRYDLQIVHRVYRSSPQERVKSLLLEQMQIVLAAWAKDDIAPYYNDMLEMMRRGMLDPSSHVRTACRHTFCSFSDMWQERLDELVSIPSQPARDLLMKEKPHAAITKAIQRKFNIAPRESPANSIRQRRTAVRQGSSTASEGEDKVFVEIKESPRQPSQRKVATEPSTRASSPARGTGRSASISTILRTAASASTASPSSMTRGASPSRTYARGASPLRVGDTSSGTVRRRATSPGRTEQPKPTSSNTYRSPPPSVGYLNPESNRHTNLEMREELPASTPPSLPQPQKRVGILEPPSSSESVEKYRVEFQERRGHLQRSNLKERDEIEYPTREGIHDVSQPQSSDSTSPPKTTRFATAALEFVSRKPAESFGYNGQSLRFDVAQAKDEITQSHDDSLYGTHCTRGQEDELEVNVTPGDWQEDVPAQNEIEADSFFDGPIPISSPAPEPRAAANITQRDRRRRTIETSNIEFKEDPVQRHDTIPHVPVLPVADPVHPVGAVQSVESPDLTGSAVEEAPPSVSIETVFNADNMATLPDNQNSSNLPASSSDPTSSDFDNQDEDKENISDENRQESFVSKPLDALANLDAIREGLKALRETQSREITSRPSKPVTSSVDKTVVQTWPTPSAVQQQNEVNTVSQEKQPSIQQYQPNAQTSAQTRTKGPQQRAALPHTNVADSSDNTSVEGEREFRPNVLNEHGATKNQPVLQTSVEEKQPNQPTRDFVREPTAFTFASAVIPAQRAQQVPVHSGMQKSFEVDSQQRHHHPIVPHHVFNQERDRLRAHNNGVTPPKTSALQPVGIPVSNPTVPPHVGGHGNRSTASAHTLANGQRQQQSYPFTDGSPAHPTDKSVQPTVPQPQPSQVTPQATESAPVRRQPVLNPKPERLHMSTAGKMLYSFCLILAAIFGLSGLIQATTKVRDAYEYHNALLQRINQFETSIVESYESVRKMDEKYSVWSEYVRELTEQDESNALHQLESIQLEVEKWQTEMKNDLLEFKRSLSGDIIDAALAHLRDPNVTSDVSTVPETST